jgi:hypothetical protein
MTDRRLHSRSVFLTPANAQLRLTVDGEIESWRGTHAVVISNCASVCGDELLVHVMSETHDVTRWRAIVMWCETIIGQPVARYRLTLSLTPAPGDGVPAV